MFDVADSLRNALDGARSSLHDAQLAVAKSDAGQAGGRISSAALAKTASAAIFTEALLAAVRSRLEALKAVAK